MKNPWMRYWFTAANTAAGIAVSIWAAEMQRQQRLLVRPVKFCKRRVGSGIMLRL